MKNLLFILILIFILLGCRDKGNHKKEAPISMDTSKVSVVELKRRILRSGDTSAYGSLSVDYIYSSYPEEFLVYSLFMANKYDYPQAYYDVFDGIYLLFDSDIESIDDKSASMAIDYLLKAYEKGHHQATDEVVMYSISRDKDCKKQMIEMFGNQ
jgi:hypothetical protein